MTTIRRGLRPARGEMSFPSSEGTDDGEKMAGRRIQGPKPKARAEEAVSWQASDRAPLAMSLRREKAKGQKGESLSCAVDCRRATRDARRLLEIGRAHV